MKTTTKAKYKYISLSGNSAQRRKAARKLGAIRYARKGTKVMARAKVAILT